MYRVLYRKWRPKVFSDVIGQPQVTTTLSSQVKENRLAHAYLFTGSRGTGKTTCAKIFSKAVNCLHPVDGNPCNECEICRGIDNGSVLDIVEIDAASNRSIDDIRQLKDEANFTPSQAKFRVYIIDEVHMLTIEAFNALLKILEEPPEHVKFVLATTEVQKLPATILSRCQRFDFRRIEPDDIADRLTYIAGQEHAQLDREAAMLIARIADGGMRDALSLLDRCISVSDNVNVETVSSSAGLMGREHIYNLVRAVSAHDTEKCLMLLDELHKGSCDTERLCTELIDRFRSFLIVKTVEKPENLLVCTSEELNEIKEIASGFTKDGVLYALNILTSASDAMRRTQNRRIEMEMAVIRMCKPETDDSAAGLKVRIAALEQELAEIKAQGIRVSTEPAAKKPEPVTEKKPEPVIKNPEPAKTEFEGFGNETGKPTFADMFSDEAESSEDDEEFDFEAFMSEHAGNHTAENKESEEMPFDDDDAPPPFDDADAPFFDDEDDSAPAASFSEDDEGERIDPKTWKTIVFETEKSFPPLIGQLTGSAARIVGNNIHIKLGDKNLKCFVSESILGSYVKKAALYVLKKEYNIKIE